MLIKRSVELLPLLLSALVGLALLTYVGFGDASRVYPGLRLQSIEPASHLTNTILESLHSEPASQQERGREVLALVNALKSTEPDLIPFFPNMSDGVFNAGDISDGSIKLEPVQIRLNAPLAQSKMESEFRDVYTVAGTTAVILLMLFAVFLRLKGEKLSVFVKTSSALAFAITTVFLTGTMLSLYLDGVIGKYRTLAALTAERVQLEPGLANDQVRLESVLGRISAAGPAAGKLKLVGDRLPDNREDASLIDRVINHTSLDIRAPLMLEGSAATIIVPVPLSRILEPIIPGFRNFIVLSLASGLLAWVFLNGGIAASEAFRHAAETPEGRGPDGGWEAKLSIIKPAYFLAIFVDSLAISFMRAFTTDAAVASGYPASSGSLPFTLFFFCLTIAQIPSGRYAEYGNLKLLMMAGIALTSLGLIVLATLSDFTAVCIGRGLAGIGQGSVYIAIQNYALAVSPPDRRTQAAAVQFSGYHGGMISGSAIGGLLAASAPPQHIFALAAALGMVAFCYVLLLLRNVPRVQSQKVATSFFHDLASMLRDLEFMKTLTLVSILSKFVLVGVALFAIPLVLHRSGFEKDKIGQIMMVFAFTSLLVTWLGAKVVDRMRSAKAAMFLGTLASGSGLLAFAVVTAGSGAESAFPRLASVTQGFQAFIADLPLPSLDVGIIVAAMVLLGLSQGLIAAPSITHIIDTPVAQRRGWSAVVSMHRLLERIGHVSGPMLVGAALAAAGGDPIVIGLIGLLTIAAGILFVLIAKRPRLTSAASTDETVLMTSSGD